MSGQGQTSEMTINGGYFLFARKAIDPGSWIMQKPPLYMKLWVWMLGRAAYKDGEKLRRGQFLTSIREMQEVCAYRIGYRKQIPTKDEVRSAYEAFAKATMITTTKTTRGMIITVLNYRLYQDKKNYDAHTEPHDDPAPKPTDTPHGSKEGLKKGRSKKEIKPKTFMSDSEEIRLGEFFFNEIHSNNPSAKEPNLQAWARDFDLMIRRDKRTPHDIAKLIRWCQKDDFEMSNVLSPAKLRARWDQLWMKMNKNGVHKQPVSSWDTLPEEPVC